MNGERCAWDGVGVSGTKEQKDRVARLNIIKERLPAISPSDAVDYDMYPHLAELEPMGIEYADLQLYREMLVFLWRVRVNEEEFAKSNGLYCDEFFELLDDIDSEADDATD